MHGEFTGTGVILVALGLLMLRWAWTASRRRPGRILAGWALIAAALVAGTDSGISDRSVALALLGLSLIAYLLIAATADRRPAARAPRAISTNRSTDAPAPRWRGLARVLLAGPAAALFALVIAILIVERGPGSDADRLVFAGFAAPLAWGLAMAWCLVEPRLARLGAGLAAAILIAGAPILVQGIQAP